MSDKAYTLYQAHGVLKDGADPLAIGANHAILGIPKEYILHGYTERYGEEFFSDFVYGYDNYHDEEFFTSLNKICIFERDIDYIFNKLKKNKHLADFTCESIYHDIDRDGGLEFKQSMRIVSNIHDIEHSVSYTQHIFGDSSSMSYWTVDSNITNGYFENFHRFYNLRFGFNIDDIQMQCYFYSFSIDSLAMSLRFRNHSSNPCHSSTIAKYLKQLTDKLIEYFELQPRVRKIERNVEQSKECQVGQIVKIKYRGMKNKFRILGPDDVIEVGDMWLKCNTSREKDFQNTLKKFRVGMKFEMTVKDNHLECGRTPVMCPGCIFVRRVL